MALSFLYQAFVRTLYLLRLFRRDSQELAIEVVMLRHEVAGLVSSPTNTNWQHEASGRFFGTHTSHEATRCPLVHASCTG